MAFVEDWDSEKSELSSIIFTVSRVFLFGFGVRPAFPRLLLDLLRLADALDARFCRVSSLDLLSRRDRLCFFLFFFFSSSVSSEEVEAGEGAEERVV